MSTFVLKANRILDLPSARQLLEVASHARPNEAIVLDLSDVKESQDAALGLIVLSLGRAGHSLSYHGLRNHQHRLVQYLGGTRARSPDHSR
jgi:anti-anti-sigma regulatory factor